ncbi:glycosyltransferase family 4 protein [Candidatus Falkowbacteria bacterium]|nr:glycosyltransferase family 4 protein [Candidatus Falkowbacteria bacterium]
MDNNKKKIYIVNQYFPFDKLGGSEIQCWLLAKHLPSLGYETKYIAVSNPKGEEAKVRKNEVLVEYLGQEDKVGLSNFFRFYKLLKNERPDVCYIRIFRFAFLLSLACRLVGVPAVFNTSTLRDCMPQVEGARGLRHKVQRYLNFRSLRKMRVVTINKEHAEILGKQGIKATPIYNSMEDDYHGGEKVNQVVWVNNIKKRKNPEAYLRLVSKFRDSNWKFIMIGNVQNEVEHYKNLIDETKKVNPNFEYLGGLKPVEVDKILGVSKIFVNTCEVEGFGNNFIQAWLGECPTITLTFDPDNIIENNKLGFYSRVEEQMAKDLEKLMHDDNLRVEMGKRARKWAKENHDINASILKYNKIFKDLIYAKKDK